MQTSELSVCSLGIFGDNVRHFWINDLNRLTDKYPVLKTPHKQDFFSIILIEKALGEIIVDSQRINLGNSNHNDVIIIPTRCITAINIDNQAKGKIICFNADFFSLRYNNNVLDQFFILKCENAPHIKLDKKQQMRLILLINLLAEEFKTQKEASVKVLRSYLNIVLFELERLDKSTKANADSGKNNHNQDRLHKFEALIDDNFITKKMPSEYAKLLYISPNYLNKICKENTGKTAGDLIRKRISIEAQRLLIYSNSSINRIAAKLGFESSSYFITFFKKYVGQTPEQFRSEMK